MHITFSLSPHLKQSLYVRITLSLPNGWRTLDKHGVCVVVTWRAADSAGAWIMDSWLASVWSGLLLLPTSFCCSPCKAGTHPACHMEPILLTQPNCPWPRALTHTVLSTFHPSPHLLCIPSQGGEVLAPWVQRLPHRSGPANTLRPRQEPDQIGIKSCPSKSHNTCTRVGMAENQKGVVLPEIHEGVKG